MLIAPSWNDEKISLLVQIATEVERIAIQARNPKADGSRVLKTRWDTCVGLVFYPHVLGKNTWNLLKQDPLLQRQRALIHNAACYIFEMTCFELCRFHQKPAKFKVVCYTGSLLGIEKQLQKLLLNRNQSPRRL